MPILPGATIGILGGGQLGRMTAMAARSMGYNIHILDPDANCAAAPTHPDDSPLLPECQSRNPSFCERKGKTHAEAAAWRVAIRRKRRRCNRLHAVRSRALRPYFGRLAGAEVAHREAVAAAEAHVTLISPFVGRILDWYKKDTGKDYVGAEDPGVQSVTTIYNYYKKFGYNTVVMGASFRNTGEIKELAGCDLLTIAPKLLQELESTEGVLPRKLDPAKAKTMDIQKLTMDKATFDKMHAADRMASDKLKEGIEGFSKALEDLEQMLEKRLSDMSEPAAAAR